MFPILADTLPIPASIPQVSSLRAVHGYVDMIGSAIPRFQGLRRPRPRNVPCLHRWDISFRLHDIPSARRVGYGRRWAVLQVGQLDQWVVRIRPSWACGPPRVFPVVMRTKQN